LGRLSQLKEFSMQTRHCLQPVVLFAALIAIASTAHARIKRITLPTRERVEIQLDNAKQNNVTLEKAEVAQ
jgi:hypothetical protein